MLSLHYHKINNIIHAVKTLYTNESVLYK